jgi:hypothetical protein
MLSKKHGIEATISDKDYGSVISARSLRECCMGEKVAQRGVGHHCKTMKSIKDRRIKVYRASQRMQRGQEGIPHRSRQHAKKVCLVGVRFYIRKT